MPGDIVYVDFVTENLQVQYNSSQAWYVLPNQEEDEVLLFKSAESEETASQGEFTFCVACTYLMLMTVNSMPSCRVLQSTSQ